MASIKQVIGLYILLDFCLLLFMTTAGASCIGEWLMHNDSLKELDMTENAIGDVGISQLMKGLHQNMSLKKLDVSECGFSVEGTTCNSSNTGGSGLPDMYTLTVGPHVYMSDKAQPHVLQITCFISLKHWKLLHSTEVVHVVLFWSSVLG